MAEFVDKKEIIASLDGTKPVISALTKYPSISELEKDIRVNVFWRNVEWTGGVMIAVLSAIKVGADFLTGSANPATVAIEIGAVVAGVRMVANGLSQGDRYYDIEKVAERANLLRPPQFHLPFR